MRMDIDIRVKIPDQFPAELRLKFIERTMDTFRELFPGAEPIYEPDGPSPVTVSFWNDDGTPYNISHKVDTDTDVSMNP
jgi:hypothetical protein